MSGFDDVKASYGHLRTKFLSFILALLGMFVLVFVIFAIVTIPIAAVLWLMAGGVENFVEVWAQDVISFFAPYMATGDLLLILVLGVVILIPLFAITEWVLGSLYGMSKDIVVSGGTTAEGAFTWFRRKAGAFLSTGAILAVIVLGPVAAIGYPISWFYGFSIPIEVSRVIGIIGFVWIFILLGFLRMYLPAVADDVGAIDGVKRSFSLVKNNFGRVFTAWTIYFILLAIWFIPILVWGFMQTGVPVPPTDITFWLAVAVAGIGAFVDLLIILPMMFLGMTAIYHDIKGQ
ncbi:MAG: hypothetical protein ACFFEA_08005 [Candidatus Thorarchaeota archaeon]